MKVLVLSHRFPFPPDHGSRIRSYHLLRHLARRHEVSLVSLLHPGDDPRAVDGLGEFVRFVLTEPVTRFEGLLHALRNVLQARPASFGYFESHRLATRLANLLEQERFDLIFVLSSSMAPYVEQVALPKILDFCDMDSLKWRDFARHRSLPASYVFALEGRRLEREEARLARCFDVVSVATMAELESLRQICGTVESDWFANGVDHTHFSPAEAAPEPDSVCFLGRMDYFPNVEGICRFFEEAWPLVRQRRPGASLTIIGANPVRSVRRLDGCCGVRVTGTVADVRVHARRAAVSIAPLTLARGTQNKILESMAMGLPVVATSVAARGIDAVAGEHLLVADHPAPFADAIVGLLENESMRRRLARAGRERVRSHHDWATCLQRVDALLERCLLRPEGIGAGTSRQPLLAAESDRRGACRLPDA